VTEPVDGDGAVTDGYSAGPGGSRRHARATVRRRRRGRRAALGAAGLALVALGGVVGLLAWDGLAARAALQQAAGLVGGLQDDVVAGDRAAATAAVTAIQEHADAAMAHSHGPHWTLAGAVPWVGDHVDAVQTVSEVVDALADDVLPGLLDATELVDPAALAPRGGRVDLAPLQEAGPLVVAADAALQAAVERVSAVDTSPLRPEVAGPVADLEAQLRDVAMTTATAARAVRLLPPMLGAEGERNYLLLVQNNAEPRASGGIPGVVAHLRAADGAVELVEQRSGGSLGDLPAPVVPLDRSELSLFGEDLAADMRDVTFTPHFPRTGEIAKAIWEQEVGGAIDGVLSVDPGALALVLGATGPLPLPPGPVADAAGGALTAENAEQVLLNTVYLTLEEPAAQDAFFGSTAAGVFGALLGGQADAVATVDALAEAARQDRLMVWSAQPDEQGLLEGTVLSGELLGERGDAPVIGVFLNDGSQAKIGYYLAFDVTAEATECREGGVRAVDVSVSLTNTAPDPATLPPYVLGAGQVVPQGEVRTNVLLYAPRGGLIEDVVVRSEAPGVTSQIHETLLVVGRTTQLAPGEAVHIDYRVLTGGQPGDMVLRTTPVPGGETSVLRGVQCLR
jgi:hypothetical protein